MKTVPLVKMKPRQKARVAVIEAGATLQHRLLSMGIYPGREITVLSNFAMRGPATIRVGRTTVAIGYGTAVKIQVELV